MTLIRKETISSLSTNINTGTKLFYVIDKKIKEITLSKEIIEQIGGLTTLPNERFEKGGKRTVIRIDINGNYFHLKEYPESPSIEYSVSSLSHLLFGYTSTPFSIFCFLNRGDGKLIPVLLSRTVLGDPLIGAGKNYENLREKDELSQVDSESFTISFYRTLLTNPNDDQPDNFVLQHTIRSFFFYFFLFLLFSFRSVFFPSFSDKKGERICFLFFPFVFLFPPSFF